MTPPLANPCPKLLAPAGNWDCAKAAVENGADAIYFGLERFNARMRANNFTEADLPELMPWLHRRGVKGYITLNTLIFPQELTAAEIYLRTMIRAGVDAVIVQDIGLCRLIRHLSPDFPIHASTQMTITSAQGVKFARNLGCQLVVLARECSLQDIERIQRQSADQSLPLEVFVHGALCVAYSGQCLTSEALGGRSANRGECAQACRMPYELIVDGQPLDLGDRHYLLSPQDLSGLDVLPELVSTGIHSFKIEGRLKTPDYVANVTRVYRAALDRVIANRTQPHLVSDDERYQLEMAFSRGLSTGWFQGIDNQSLVHARFGKKRGVFLGTIVAIGDRTVTVSLTAPVKPGDGIVFDQGKPEAVEQGGRVYRVEMAGENAILSFGKDHLNLRRLRLGDRLWKTSDPALDKQVRQTYQGDRPQFQRPLHLECHGVLDAPLVVIGRDDQGHCVQVTSDQPLVAAQNQPLERDRLVQQFGRLGNTPFRLETLEVHLTGEVILPVSSLNQLRRELVAQLEEQRSQPPRWQLLPTALSTVLPSLPTMKSLGNGGVASAEPTPYRHSLTPGTPELIGLVRNLEQMEAAIAAGLRTLYCDFEDPRRYRMAVEQFRTADLGRDASIWVAPPRITKPAETWILEQVKRSQADGYLVRNYDHLAYFADDRCRGDFSLNVANPLTADYFINHYHLERVTAAYDLNHHQLCDLLRQAPPHWLEITIHQHMPMFHMEHCVFCAFLSEGTDFTNCGRPCEQHTVLLREGRRPGGPRVSTDHVLSADAGCRNTVLNGTAQTGAEHVQQFLGLGAIAFRLEFLKESTLEVTRAIAAYQQLLAGEISGQQLWKSLNLTHQLGVTRGTFSE